MNNEMGDYCPWYTHSLLMNPGLEDRVLRRQRGATTMVWYDLRPRCSTCTGPGSQFEGGQLVRPKTGSFVASL